MAKLPVALCALLLASSLAAGTAAAGAAARSGPQGESWASIAQLPDMVGVYEINRGGGFGGRRTTPPSLGEESAQMLKDYQDGQKRGENLDVETANCLPPGMPQIMDQPYPIEILFTPGKVTIIQEAYMQVRHIYTDGRGHPEDPDLTFNGHSIGHWENGTLVVSTTGLAPEALLDDGIEHSPNERITERIRLVSPEVLEIATRIEDPVILAKPWEYVTRYARHRTWTITEFICAQNNRNSIDEQGRPGIKLD